VKEWQSTAAKVEIDLKIFKSPFGDVGYGTKKI
jgi:hypothetical protein